MDTREIKSLKVNGKEYAYIELKTGDGVIYYNTTFIQVPITDKYLGMFESIGGFSREVLHDPAKELDVNQLTIISKTVESNTIMTHFIYENDNEKVELLTTVEGQFLGYVIDLFKKNEDIVGKMTVQNSLNYVEDEQYGEYLEDYIEPVSLKQSGLFYKGEPILYGESFEIRGLTNIQDILGGDLLIAVKDGGVNTLHVQVKERTGMFNIVTEEILLKEDGSIYTNLEHAMLESKTNLTQEEFFNKEVKETAERLSDKSMERAYNMVDNDLNEPYVILINSNSLNHILKQEGIAFKKLSKENK